MDAWGQCSRQRGSVHPCGRMPGKFQKQQGEELAGTQGPGAQSEITGDPSLASAHLPAVAPVLFHSHLITAAHEIQLKLESIMTLYSKSSSDSLPPAE